MKSKKAVGRKYMRWLLPLAIAIVLLLSLLPLAHEVYASTLYEYYNTGDVAANAAYSGAYWQAQTFTPSVSHTITSVQLKFFRLGFPSTITVSIRATSLGHPTGGDLCSGTTNGNTLTTSEDGAWREITLGDGYALVSGVKYAIVVRALSGDANNKVFWRKDNTSPTYAGGCKEESVDGGFIWTSDTNSDFMFEEWGGVWAAPSVVTNAASNVAGTTARLNSTVDDDGGEACEARWGWGEFPEATIGEYENKTSYSGSYTTNQHPFLDVDSLDPSTLYYFRVELRNNQGEDLGSELNFTTSSEEYGNPSDFRAYPSSTSVSLTWTKGVGTTNSIVRVRYDTYPTSHTDGAPVYDGASSSCTYSGLTSGTTYYFAVWGESGGEVSSGSAKVMATTSAGDIYVDEDAFPAPPTPLRWLVGTDYTNMSNLPIFYDTINFIATTLEIPKPTVWLSLFIGLALGVGIIGYAVSEGSVFVGLIAMLIGFAFGYAVKQIPLAMPVLLLLILIPVFFVRRREAY